MCQKAVPWVLNYILPYMYIAGFFKGKRFLQTLYIGNKLLMQALPLAVCPSEK